MWFSAAVADPLHGQSCCAFRDALLHPLAVTSGNLDTVAFLSAH